MSRATSASSAPGGGALGAVQVTLAASSLIAPVVLSDQLGAASALGIG